MADGENNIICQFPKITSNSDSVYSRHQSVPKFSLVLLWARVLREMCQSHEPKSTFSSVWSWTSQWSRSEAYYMSRPNSKHSSLHNSKWSYPHFILVVFIPVLLYLLCSSDASDVQNDNKFVHFNDIIGNSRYINKTIDSRQQASSTYQNSVFIWDDIESPQFADSVRNTLIDDEAATDFVSTSSSRSEGTEKNPLFKLDLSSLVPSQTTSKSRSRKNRVKYAENTARSRNGRRSMMNEKLNGNERIEERVEPSKADLKRAKRFVYNKIGDDDHNNETTGFTSAEEVPLFEQAVVEEWAGSLMSNFNQSSKKSKNSFRFVPF